MADVVRPSTAPTVVWRLERILDGIISVLTVAMTVLMNDAKKDLADEGVQLGRDCFANDLIYADDTLLIDVNGKVLEKLMNSVGKVGRKYGLTFNWKKQ